MGQLFRYKFLFTSFVVLLLQGCAKNSDCFGRLPELVLIEMPENGIKNKDVLIEVTYKSIHTDDYISSSSRTQSGNNISYEFYVMSCNGIKIPRTKTEMIRLLFQNEGSYTVTFSSESGDPIVKTILIE